MESPYANDWRSVVVPATAVVVPTVVVAAVVVAAVIAARSGVVVICVTGAGVVFDAAAGCAGALRIVGVLGFVAVAADVFTGIFGGVVVDAVLRGVILDATLGGVVDAGLGRVVHAGLGDCVDAAAAAAARIVDGAGGRVVVDGVHRGSWCAGLRRRIDGHSQPD